MKSRSLPRKIRRLEARLVRGKIFRVASAPFGPFDPFRGAWHLFALLADGVDGWSPKYRY